MYDGTPSDPVKEMAELAIKNEVIPRYKADGTLDQKGRQFKFEATYTDEEGNEQIETLFAKSKAEIIPELRNLPHVQEQILEYLKNPEKAPALYETDGEEEDEDEDFGFDESGSPAEEIESWENLD